MKIFNVFQHKSDFYMLDIEAFLKLMEIKYFDDKETGVLNIGSEQPQSIIYEYDIR